MTLKVWQQTVARCHTSGYRPQCTVPWPDTYYAPPLSNVTFLPAWVCCTPDLTVCLDLPCVHLLLLYLHCLMTTYIRLNQQYIHSLQCSPSVRRNSSTTLVENHPCLMSQYLYSFSRALLVTLSVLRGNYIPYNSLKLLKCSFHM